MRSIPFGKCAVIVTELFFVFFVTFLFEGETCRFRLKATLKNRPSLLSAKANRDCHQFSETSWTT